MNYLIGIEREGLRIDPNGKMASTPHPVEFGDKLENPLVGTDFGEAMLELRTRPHTNPTTCYEELCSVTRWALGILHDKGELLWPYSVPGNTPDVSDFPYNRYPSRPDMEEYERLITQVYGIKRMCLAGIHVNFSIGAGALEELREAYPSVPKNMDEAYLRCARNVLAHQSALRCFFDASPTDFEGNVIEENSLRNSPAGFRNANVEKLDYGSKVAYLRSLGLTASFERVSAVRLKSKDKEKPEEGIARYGIERLEFRLCDIDPFDICGVSLDEMTFVLSVLFMCMAVDEIPDTPDGILERCGEVNERLRLGFGGGIARYVSRQRSGATKSDDVRALLLDKGNDGLLELAQRYGEVASEAGVRRRGRLR